MVNVVTEQTARLEHKAAARTKDAVKVYGKGQTEVRALDGVSVEFAAGRYTAIMGPSGSGKSTLLHCVAGLDNLTSGNHRVQRAVRAAAHCDRAGGVGWRGRRDRAKPQSGKAQCPASHCDRVIISDGRLPFV